jgi:rubrerythrin
MENRSINDLLDIAIKKEEEAFKSYSKMATEVSDKFAKETLEFLALEEQKHKVTLENYKNGNLKEAMDLSKVVDYKIVEHIERPNLNTGSEAKDVYLFAAHEELGAYNFYMELANLHQDGEAKELLLKMANEEKKHKEKLEYYYTNTAFPEDGI